MTTCDPYWTTYLSAFSVPAIAVLGAAIAYRQWRTAQNKLKLDLFESALLCMTPPAACWHQF